LEYVFLVVLPSHDQLGNTGQKTGFWLEEFTDPYYEFIDNGYEVTIASPKGGKPPVDPKSIQKENQSESTQPFEEDKTAQEKLENTLVLSQVSASDYDTHTDRHPDTIYLSDPNERVEDDVTNQFL
jgi:putative intracellular protease/amidase